MKPDVASMEALLWSKCFRDTDEGRAYREDMQKAIDWLHAHGIKAMVYLRAGELDRENVGFKEEYLIKTIELCKERDIPLFLFKSPALERKDAQEIFNTVALIAEVLQRTLSR